MEDLVRLSRRSEHVVVDATARDRVEDRIADNTAARVAPHDDQCAFRMGVQPPGLIEQSAALGADERERNEQDGDLGPSRGEILEARGRLRWRREAADVVLAAVPVVELPLELDEAVGCVVHDDDRWARHRRTVPEAPQPRGPSGPPPDRQISGLS